MNIRSAKKIEHLETDYRLTSVILRIKWKAKKVQSVSNFIDQAFSLFVSELKLRKGKLQKADFLRVGRKNFKGNLNTSSHNNGARRSGVKTKHR